MQIILIVGLILLAGADLYFICAIATGFRWRFDTIMAWIGTLGAFMLIGSMVCMVSQLR